MAQSANPYAAPDAANVAATENPLQGRLSRYSPQELKKLYYRSCNVSGIAGLMILGIAGIIAALAFSSRGNQEDINIFYAIIIPFLVFDIIAVIGLILRTNWGRTMGIIVSIIMLIRIPIGTAIGIMGLFAFFKAKELFGNDRITHKELKVAFKDLKKNKII